MHDLITEQAYSFFFRRFRVVLLFSVLMVLSATGLYAQTFIRNGRMLVPPTMSESRLRARCDTTDTVWRTQLDRFPVQFTPIHFFYGLPGKAITDPQGTDNINFAFSPIWPTWDTPREAPPVKKPNQQSPGKLAFGNGFTGKFSAGDIPQIVKPLMEPGLRSGTIFVCWTDQVNGYQRHVHWFAVTHEETRITLSPDQLMNAFHYVRWDPDHKQFVVHGEKRRFEPFVDIDGTKSFFKDDVYRFEEFEIVRHAGSVIGTGVRLLFSGDDLEYKRRFDKQMPRGYEAGRERLIEKIERAMETIRINPDYFMAIQFGLHGLDGQMSDVHLFIPGHPYYPRWLIEAEDS